jgi:hypothetical protein
MEAAILNLHDATACRSNLREFLGRFGSAEAQLFQR